MFDQSSHLCSHLSAYFGVTAPSPISSASHVPPDPLMTDFHRPPPSDPLMDTLMEDPVVLITDGYPPPLRQTL